MSLYFVFFQALRKHCLFVLSFKEGLGLKTVTLLLASILHFVSILFESMFKNIRIQFILWCKIILRRWGAVISFGLKQNSSLSINS